MVVRGSLMARDQDVGGNNSVSSGRCGLCGYFGQVHYRNDEGNGPLICLQCFTNGRCVMGWGDVAGKTDGGPRDERHMSIKPNQTIKIHILLDQGEEPVSYWQHFIKLEKGGRSVICPGKDVCPACATEGVRSKKVHALNVYDYESKSIKILEQGNSVMQQLKLIYDQYGSFDMVDISIRRVGEGLATQYLVMPMPLMQAFQLPTGLSKHNLKALKVPTSIDKINSILKGDNTSFDTQEFDKELPPLPQTAPSTKPKAVQFGKYNGKTIEEIADIDMNYVRWCADNIQDPLIKKEAQRLSGKTEVSSTQQGEPKPVANGNKQALVSEAYNLINNDPRYKGNLPSVIEKMKEVTSSTTHPNGKMLLQDYSEEELTKLIGVLK